MVSSSSWGISFDSKVSTNGLLHRNQASPTGFWNPSRLMTLIFVYTGCSLLASSFVEASTLVSYMPVTDRDTTTGEYEDGPQNHQIQSTYEAYVAALEETGAYSPNQVYISGPDWTTLMMRDTIVRVSFPI